MRTTLSRATTAALLALMTLTPALLAGVDPRDSRGFLGVELDELTAELQSHFGAPEGLGVLISRVEEQSPAWRAGLRVGDVITSIEGRDIDSPWTAKQAIGERPGETVRVELVRNGSSEQLMVELGTRTRYRHPARHREIRIEADMEELEAELEQLGRQMEALGEEIGRQVERALEDVDWAEIGETIERSIEHSLRALEGIEIEVDLDEMERELERSLEALEESLEELEDLEIEISSPST